MFTHNSNLIQTVVQVDQNTLALYNFEGNGNDSSKNGYTLTTNGTIIYSSTPKPIYQGLTCAGPFNDSNFYNYPAALGTAINGLTNWTVEFFIYFINLAHNSVAIDMDTAQQNTIQFITDGSIRLTISNANLNTATGLITTGRWYHVACSYDGSLSKIYINGLLKVSSGMNSTLSAPTGTNRAIGRYVAVGNLFVDGFMDQIRFSNKARNIFPRIN